MASPDARVLRLEHGHDRVFLVMNEGTEPVDTTAAFRVAGHFTLLGADGPRRYPGDATYETTFELGPGSAGCRAAISAHV